METRTYNVYKCEELKPEAKSKAIEKWYEGEYYPCLEEDILEYIKELDVLGIFSNIKPSYSLSNCQGDGLCFSANIDLEKWLKHKKVNKVKMEKILEEVYKLFSSGNKGRYCYASKTDIQWEGQGNESEETCHLMDDYCQEIANYYLEICRKAEKNGYSILKYRMDNKEFSELCESNGYMFKENGQLD
jgi:hypothetical protein